MNRKHITQSYYYELENEVYSINSKPSGCYTPILRKGIEQMNACHKKWGRTFVYFFGLHDHKKTETSEAVSKFIDRLKYQIKKRYQLNEMGFLWVREHEKAKSQHYHLMIILDGDKIQNSKALAKIIKTTWEIDEGKTISYVKNSFYFVDSQSKHLDAVNRFSYLAKARGKGYRPPQAKDYNSSRLKAPETQG